MLNIPAVVKKIVVGVSYTEGEASLYSRYELREQKDIVGCSGPGKPAEARHLKM